LARHWAEAGEIDRAIGEWTRATAAARARQAYLEAQEGYQQALALLVTLPETPERDAREMDLMSGLGGVLQITQGEAAPAAVAAIARCRALAEKDGSLVRTIEVVSQECSQTVAAGNLLDAALLSEQLLSGLAEAQAQAGAASDAIATFERALSANPEERQYRADMFCARGEVWLSLGEHGAAEAVSEKRSHSHVRAEVNCTNCVPASAWRVCCRSEDMARMRARCSGLFMSGFRRGSRCWRCARRGGCWMGWGTDCRAEPLLRALSWETCRPVQGGAVSAPKGNASCGVARSCGWSSSQRTRLGQSAPSTRQRSLLQQTSRIPSHAIVPIPQSRSRAAPCTQALAAPFPRRRAGV
jgi:hypothetical protein